MYKRQRIQLPLASWRKTVGCSLEIPMRRMRRGDSTGLSLMPMESWSLAGLRVRMESGITPVSYTHLDVYKRQGMSLAYDSH